MFPSVFNNIYLQLTQIENTEYDEHVVFFLFLNLQSIQIHLQKKIVLIDHSLIFATCTCVSTYMTSIRTDNKDLACL